MPKQLPERWGDLGAFIREQRSTARLSLRRLSELAGISNPYLSQIERGLRRPSAEILQQIAKALRISAETLYVQAGILEPGTGDADLAREILADPFLTEDQKQALIRIYLSFRHENEVTDVLGPVVPAPAPAAAAPAAAAPAAAAGAAAASAGAAATASGVDRGKVAEVGEAVEVGRGRGRSGAGQS
jgi:transcriptional regulator with XRE-family HTH domain